MEESNRHKTFCNPQCSARKNIVLDLKYLLSISENIDKTLQDFSNSQDEEFKELCDFPHTSFNESPRFLEMNFAEISMEETALNFPLSQDLNNAMLRIISRIQKLKETENQLMKTYKNACNSQDKEEIQRLTAQLREMSQEVEFLSKQIEENEEEREKTIKSDCKDCGKNVQKLKEFKGEIEEIKKELIKADELLNSTRKEKADLESAYMDLQKQLEELKDFDPKEYEAAFAGLNSEKDDLIKLNKELARKYNMQENMIWKIEKELENASAEIEEKDHALIIARNMIAKLQSTQNELERKLKQQKQMTIQNKLKGQSFAEIESHEGMLRNEIYNLHDKIEKISIESDREVKNREELIRKLNEENNDLKQAFDEIEGKLKEIESESKIREENHQNEVKKLTESLAEKEESISQLSKQNQEQLKLKDLELTQMKRSINSGICIDNEKSSVDEEKSTLRSTTPIKRKSPVKTYAKMPIKQAIRSTESMKTSSDRDSIDQPDLAETERRHLEKPSIEKPNIEKPLSMLWREQLKESLKKESLYKKQLGKINEQENQFFKERIKILGELGSTKHQLSEKLRMREEEYESKINEIATKQQNLIKIIEEMEKSLLAKDKQIKEQNDLYLCDISELKKLVDIYRDEITYRNDIFRKNYLNAQALNEKINALNSENSKLRQKLEESKRDLSLIINEKGATKDQYRQAEEIIDSLKHEIQLAENELLSIPKFNYLTEEKPTKLYEEKPTKLYEKIKEMKIEYAKSFEFKEIDIKTIKNLQAKLNEMEDYYEKALTEKAAINQQLITRLLHENNDSNSAESSKKTRKRLETLYRNLKSSAESILKVAKRLQEIKWSLSYENTSADIILRVFEMVLDFFENFIIEHKNDEKLLLKAIKELSNSATKPQRSSRSLRSSQ